MSFVFTKENLQKAKAYLKKYPKERSRSALLPLLDLAQRQNGGWLSKEAMVEVARFLDLPEIRVYEVATFYTMFNLKPVGKNFIQVCTTTPCWLRGSQDILETCLTTLGVEKEEVTKDGLFSVVEVECLGACVNAPMVQINDDYYEDLTPEAMGQILKTLQQGDVPAPGSARGRRGAEPERSSL